MRISQHVICVCLYIWSIETKPIVIFLHQGKGEAVCGAEAHLGPAAGSRGSWAAPAVPVDCQRENQKAPGISSHYYYYVFNHVKQVGWMHGNISRSVFATPNTTSHKTFILIAGVDSRAENGRLKDEWVQKWESKISQWAGKHQKEIPQPEKAPQVGSIYHLFCIVITDCKMHRSSDTWRHVQCVSLQRAEDQD